MLEVFVCRGLQELGVHDVEELKRLRLGNETTVACRLKSQSWVLSNQQLARN